ncbi:serine O-acetyltransferase EpsC [Flavobacterium chuncheonense]|uniref:Serine O-acetyltransferase EpsC n=1 Tax=Flavobacterium chuncheonense TaxID=2026653 RepID=A0ABW5YLE7_9FLAO
MSTKETSDLEKLFQVNLLEARSFLNKKEVELWMEQFFTWLFCTQQECIDFQVFQQRKTDLENRLVDFLKGVNTKNASEVSTSFFSELVVIHQVLLSDLEAIVAFDPAAKSRSEVLLAYPGFFTITVYRIAHYLWEKGVAILPRVLSEYAHSKTGIDIHPGATIGKQFFIDHGTGIVIGETAIIGDNVKIYQGVTLGALSVSKDKAEIKRHPTIEDNVIIYANATILGGKTVVGKDSVIGGNVWLTDSVSSQTLVFHKGEVVVRDKIEVNTIIDFSI